MNNTNLPQGCQDNNVWRGVVVPTYQHYLSFSLDEDPWSFDDEYAADILQKIWDKIYDGKTKNKDKRKTLRPLIRHTIQPGGAVFVVVSTWITLT
jgi:hypothetical protein